MGGGGGCSGCSFFSLSSSLGGKKVEKDREKENIDLQSGGEMSHGKDYGASKNLLIALYGERFGSLPTPI